ncbi:hypothetical protein Tco_1141768, partial [Tanacetum coccineum]
WYQSTGYRELGKRKLGFELICLFWVSARQDKKEEKDFDLFVDFYYVSPSGELDGTPTLSDGRDTTKTNVGNQNGYNAVQNVGNQVVQNAVQNLGVQNVRNQNGLIVVPGIANQNPNGNGNVVEARAEGNAIGNNGNQIRCYNYRGLGHLARNCIVRPRRRDAAYLQTQLLIAQKEEAGIQLQVEEFDLMAVVADLDEIEEVNAEEYE